MLPSITMPFIPYFATSRYRVRAMIDLADIHPGEKAADLGSGDGRILVALSLAGAEAYGYELDESYIQLAQENIAQQIHGAPHILLPTIYKRDFWQEDVSIYTVITVYPMPDIMEALEAKLQKELAEGARVLTNYYPFPTWKEEIKKDNIYLYRK